jgi:methyl-accepting chemotaxis protein
MLFHANQKKVPAVANQVTVTPELTKKKIADSVDLLAVQELANQTQQQFKELLDKEGVT